ncbi:Amino Acid-Polyamine-Organocation (APC) Family [Achlya hypogyna]|uniref:Amino Acid-Polyamine-Organocation (APC) Family n=1 Tax=Achlya hypogyna TaxID=1202772 RepID=A0A1V9ZU66_ACHHY|nr:Amino Acid-Polyamine-Organocation (APC) Family [Achlya hypogyna]
MIIAAKAMGFIDNLFRTKPIDVIHAEERKEELPRELGLIDLILIGIGGTVGSGVFATTGSIIGGTAGAAAFLSWVIAGVSCIISGFAYMEMSSLIPSSGSTYAYSYHVLGELPAVVAAWLLTLEYGISGAGVARSWASKVQEWAREDLPVNSTKADWINDSESISFLACMVMVLSVAILLGGIKFGKIFINTITTTKVAIVIFIIVAGFSYINTDNLSPFIPPLIPATSEEPAKFGVQGVMLGASQAFFGYVGFDEVCCLAAEAKDPRRVMPRAVIGVVLGTMFLSSFASLALSCMMPYNAVESDNFYFSTGFQYVGAKWASTIVHIGETGTMPVVVLISFLAQPRLMYAMSVDGLLPKIFGKVEKNGNLFWCTLISGIFFTLIALFVPFDYLWNMVSFGILVSFNMTNSALILNRTREQSSQFVYKLTGAMVAISCLAMMLFEKGYALAVGPATGYLVVSMILLVVTFALATIIYVKCPQSFGPIDSYRAPLVPFVPCLAITINWYLIAQLPWRDIGLGFGWIGLAILSYFAYGYRYSAGKDGWSTMLADGYIGHNSVIDAEERKEELPRELGLVDLILIGVGSTVGSGVFATTGDIISKTAGAAAFLSWLIAGFSCILNGFAYMEMSSLVPSSGSTYAYSYYGLGELPAVVAGWLLTLEYGICSAGVARSWAGKVQEWVREGLPAGSTKADWFNDSSASLLGALCMGVCAGIVLVGIKFGKHFINVVTSIKVSVVLFIIIVGFIATQPSNFSPFVPPLIPATGDKAAKYGVQGVMLGASQAFFGYTGFDEVCCMAAEAKNPRKVVPRAVIGVILGTMFLSAFASLALSGMIPYNANPPNGFYFSAGFQNQGYNWAATIVHVGEVCTMPIVVLVGFLAQPRVLYAMAVDGLCPPIFGRVDKNGNLFWNTLITGVFFTIIALLVPFDYLWNLVSLGILVGFNMTNSAQIIVRTRDSSAGIVYKLTGAMVATSCLSMFLFQKGYVIATEPANGYLIASMVLLGVVVGLTFTIYYKCPQSIGASNMYRAPGMPFVPALAITCNWYLIAQMGTRDISLCIGWIALAVISYFLYGIRFSAGKTGWASMLAHGYTGLNSVRPSLASQIAGERKDSILGQKHQSALK